MGRKGEGGGGVIILDLLKFVLNIKSKTWP